MSNNETHFPKYRINFEPNQLSGWKRIFRDRNCRKYPKKSIIVNQGQSVNYLYFIVKGLIEYTYINDGGTEELVEVLGDQNLFGLQAIFGDNHSAGFFITLEDSIISSISILELKKYLSKDNNLSKELLEELSKVTNGLTRQIFEQRLTAEERVEETIYCLAEYYVKRGGDFENQIFIPLSQTELARISRTTRVTVTKVLSKLKKLQLIHTAYAGLIIYNFNKKIK
ncbi:cAMP-binding domain of CRP or a regulatory subunit of cAMP-dependent protein kinases [Clostridium acidisoli DSM 12555]|uniref:cAMP-binding domain of CRP or a regulatory subunit of cAMP-dependent protein kinases n=1 Tax=Clostridium acidisoli DSM 12555 TaxID=1121291 RepID=A0A1W1X3H4_9CLOT|nr:Crp/Fnr family transcriptional regulator [Clostridium acidisoli]SMC18472.1 cAMP-binding domain of CRP or a regulatory subunit of cAMP-dependent protein kinases [Clostridium acidisoli DSM 12555]